MALNMGYLSAIFFFMDRLLEEYIVNAFSKEKVPLGTFSEYCRYQLTDVKIGER